MLSDSIEGWVGFPDSSAGKESTCNAGDLSSVPRLGRSPGEGKSYPLQYSGLENSTNCIIHGVVKSRTRLGDFHFQRAEMEWEVGRRFKREGAYVYLWLIHVYVWQKLTQYCQAIILQ